MVGTQANKFFPMYDQLFKDVYAFTEHALELLKAILSKAELAILDLSQIRLEKESFTKGLRSGHFEWTKLCFFKIRKANKFVI